MLDAGFYSPRTEAGRFDACCYGDGAVLMPTQRPVGRFTFVEEDGADRTSRFAEILSSMVADRSCHVEQGA